MKDKRFTEYDMYTLVHQFKPKGLIKFRNLTMDFEMHVQPAWLLGQTARIIIETWMGQRHENFGIPPYLPKALETLNKELYGNRSTIQTTPKQLFDDLFQILGPLEAEQEWDPPAQTVCEKIVCALFLNEFLSYTFCP